VTSADSPEPSEHAAQELGTWRVPQTDPSAGLLG
jgi:hypothetical protein